MIRRIAAFAVVSFALALAAASPTRADVVPEPPAQAPANAPEVPPPRAMPTFGMTPENAKLALERPIIDLMTMGIGSLLWERHGHIALCVLYGDARDRCYNYGVGDFHNPISMAWGFLRANGAFWVDKAPPEEMLWIYKHTDRTIWHQPLPLTQEQKQKIIDKLEYDVMPEHKHYAYDHFWDNCTTRVRDVIDNAIGGQLAKMPETTEDRTYRDLARDGFFGVELAGLGPRLALLITDIAMGRATDRVPSYNERMFLPQYLREAVTKLWGVQPQVIYQRKGPPQEPDGPSGRVLLALLIVVLTAPAWIAARAGRLQRTGLLLAILPYFVLGTVETVLAIISPLPYIRWNEICLVWLPFDILVPFVGPSFRRKYARGRLIMLAALVVLHAVNIIKAPVMAPMLWPAIPMAVAALRRDTVRR